MVVAITIVTWAEREIEAMKRDLICVSTHPAWQSKLKETNVNVTGIENLLLWMNNYDKASTLLSLKVYLKQ
jgi:hypothetical protein